MESVSKHKRNLTTYPPGKESVSISIGNEQFSFFAMEKGKPAVKGVETFSIENPTHAIDTI